MITLNNVTKTYSGGTIPAVRGVSLRIERGELFALIGESGCGKTTTLRMINRLVEPSSGEIRIGGSDARGLDPVELRRKMGYVIQGTGLFPHYTVAENVGIVPRLLRWSGDDIRRRVDEMLELVGLPPGEYRDRNPGELSGGQQQRVGVARALAARPEILLMDEPLGALDPLTRGQLQEELVRIRSQISMTGVLVTHDMAEALLLADRVGIMKGGTLVQSGTARELMTHPLDEYVKSLVDTPLNWARRLESLGDDPPAVRDQPT